MIQVVSSQSKLTITQNYIRLELGPFRARLLDFLIQNFGSVTTPSHEAILALFTTPFFLCTNLVCVKLFEEATLCLTNFKCYQT